MKKILAIVLSLTMLLSLDMLAYADEQQDHEHETETAIGQQISFIASHFDKMLKQNDGGSTWYYTVTDLDHNGRLELLANTKDEKGQSQLKGWEFSPDGKSMILCTAQVIPAPVGAEEENVVLDSMILNLHSNSVDTHYDPETDTYYYSFVDATEISGVDIPGDDQEFIAVNSNSVMTGVGAVSMKNGNIAPSIILGSCVSYSVDDGDLKVACFNGKGEAITMDEFLSLSLNAFPDLPRFNTAFDWFTADEATILERFVKSYATFDGVADEDLEEGGVALTAAQEAGGVYVTKNPTDEKHNPGEKAIFIANANIYDRVTWTFVAPDGKTYNEQEFTQQCGGSTETADGGTKLRVKDVNAGMNGWGVFATFDYRGASARTATAYIYVWGGSTSSAGSSGGSTGMSGSLADFYDMKPWLDDAWGCPICGTVTSGSQCWSCGFNPVAYYATYYGVTPDSYSWYYGVNGQTPVNELTPDPFVGVLAWICPVCGESTQNATVCWNCGYHYGDPVGVNNVDTNSIMEAQMGANLRQCQYCGEWFNSDYDVCPRCGRAPNDGTEANYDAWLNTVQEVNQGATLRQCEYCGNYFNNDYDVCPYCHGAPNDSGFDVNGPDYGMDSGYVDDGPYWWG